MSKYRIPPRFERYDDRSKHFTYVPYYSSMSSAMYATGDSVYRWLRDAYSEHDSQEFFNTVRIGDAVHEAMPQLKEGLRRV